MLWSINIWASWVDDMIGIGKRSNVLKAKDELMTHFECEDVGELKEYVGCKIEYDPDKRKLKMTQPVLLQSLQDEFDLPGGEIPATPAIPGSVLSEIKGKPLPEAEQKVYRSGTGKLLHLMKWSRPDTLNAVRELSRFMSEAGAEHRECLDRLHPAARTLRSQSLHGLADAVCARLRGIGARLRTHRPARASRHNAGLVKIRRMVSRSQSAAA